MYVISNNDFRLWFQERNNKQLGKNKISLSLDKMHDIFIDQKQATNTLFQLHWSSTIALGSITTNGSIGTRYRIHTYKSFKGLYLENTHLTLSHTLATVLVTL